MVLYKHKIHNINLSTNIKYKDITVHAFKFIEKTKNNKCKRYESSYLFI